MTLKNTSSAYGTVAKTLHWTLSVLIITMLIVGAWMVGLDDGPVKFTSFTLHKSTGLVILALMLCRLVWMLMNIKPALPPQTKAWERFLEKSVHYLFYLLLFVMPLSGWVMSVAAGYTPTFYGLFEVPFFGLGKSEMIAEIASDLHYVVAWLITALLILHVAAALKHHFLDKDDVLKRMI